MRDEMLPLAQLAGAFAFEGARRLWSTRGHIATPPPPILTDRQRDCVLWAARGKGDWEISRLLGVGEETVAGHTKPGCARYGGQETPLMAIRAVFDRTPPLYVLFRRGSAGRR